MKTKREISAIQLLNHDVKQRFSDFQEICIIQKQQLINFCKRGKWIKIKNRNNGKAIYRRVHGCFVDIDKINSNEIILDYDSSVKLGIDDLNNNNLILSRVCIWGWMLAHLLHPNRQYRMTIWLALFGLLLAFLALLLTLKPCFVF